MVKNGFKTLFMDNISYPPINFYQSNGYVNGTNNVQNLTKVEQQAQNDIARSRREQVREAMEHSWKGYSNFAWGKDELLPVSSSSRNNFGALAVTLVDSLDTLWLMGMKKEFYEARDWIRDYLTFEADEDISVFETTIRSLGGLLAAYDMSGDAVFLEKADELGTRLLQAFDSPSGIPFGVINLAQNVSFGHSWTMGASILAELGTLQIEFRYLSKVTGKKIYAEKVEKVSEIMSGMVPFNGLFPIFVTNRAKVKFSSDILNKISLGAMGDSFYEYLLKIWLQGGKTEEMYRRMWDSAVDGIHDYLLHISTPSGLHYIAEMFETGSASKINHKMDHLTCFLGGTLALGAYTDPQGLTSARAQRDLRTGKAMAYTCYQMYTRMMTGVAPEYVEFTPGEDFKTGLNGRHSFLRPETVETLFILFQLTGDETYREWGWDIFQAIQKNCRTSVGYGGLWDVTSFFQQPMDRMESFFLAETLKYLYLLFDPDSEIDILGKHVFNTEAHPLRMFSEMSKSASH